MNDPGYLLARANGKPGATKPNMTMGGLSQSAGKSEIDKDRDEQRKIDTATKLAAISGANNPAQPTSSSLPGIPTTPIAKDPVVVSGIGNADFSGIKPALPATPGAPNDPATPGTPVSPTSAAVGSSLSTLGNSTANNSLAARTGIALNYKSKK